MPLKHLCLVLAIFAAQVPKMARAVDIEPATPFAFAAIGDVPYHSNQEWLVKEVLNEIARSPAELVVHVGDFKAGDEPCSDELFLQRKNLLNQSPKPLIYVVGDNEWADCGRSTAGAFVPIERLARLRELFFADNASLGQNKLNTLTRQADISPHRRYVENLRWEQHGALFASFNLPGPNNHFTSVAGQNEEFEDRRAAHADWLTRTFAYATRKKIDTVILLAQANLHFELQNDAKGRALITTNRARRDGFYEFKQQLADLTEKFTGEVLFIHGDTHHYQLNQPLFNAQGKVLKNFTRLETFGHPFTNQWIFVSVWPTAKPRFKAEIRTHSLNQTTP
jgi:hypothetical protein